MGRRVGATAAHGGLGVIDSGPLEWGFQRMSSVAAPKTLIKCPKGWHRRQRNPTLGINLVTGEKTTRLRRHQL